MHEFSSNREMQTYRYGFDETPFLRKDQNEDQTLGYAVKAAHFWKTLSLIGLSVSFLVLLGIVFEVARPQIHVLFAEVLSNGFVQNVGWLTTQS